MTSSTFTFSLHYRDDDNVDNSCGCCLTNTMLQHALCGPYDLQADDESLCIIVHSTLDDDAEDCMHVQYVSNDDDAIDGFKYDYYHMSSNLSKQIVEEDFDILNLRARQFDNKSKYQTAIRDFNLETIF